jgi:hypothetical protein
VVIASKNFEGKILYQDFEERKTKATQSYMDYSEVMQL